MAIREYETEQEMEDDFERIEELCMEYADMQERLNDAESEVESIQREIDNFREDYPEIVKMCL